MVDFEPVTGGAAVHGATAIPVDDVMSQLPVHGPTTPSQIDGPAMLDKPNLFDLPITAFSRILESNPGSSPQNEVAS
jgi:hypothetical protein